MKLIHRAGIVLALGAALPLAAAARGHVAIVPGLAPGWIDNVVTETYDGVGDDLLTAGLGASGLASAAPPIADPLAPTASELRRLAIYTNYRALVDMTAGGGYGSLYGPAVGAGGGVDGKIAGAETRALLDTGLARERVTLMVQVPATFDAARPCIVTATSSGSRGVYGAISTGEWGLKQGCAVAYTDKGTGAAPHDLAGDSVALIDGTRAPASAAGSDAIFRAPLSAAGLAALNAATPNRHAFKHAHSRLNPERHWGRYTLFAVAFAFDVLNGRYGAEAAGGRHRKLFLPRNTLVIASSISNGGGAAIAAAELDRHGLIDGVAVAEPQIVLPEHPKVRVQRGDAEVASSARSLYDYTSWANLYQPCATQAAQLANAPGRAFVPALLAATRCQALHERGLLAATTPEGQAAEALQKLRDHGWEADADLLHASHAAFEVAPAVTTTYANALSRSGVEDHLCGFSYAGIDAGARPAALGAGLLESMFATGNGVPPAAGVQLINNASPGGAVRSLVSFSASTGAQDMNLDGTLCLRDLHDGSGAAARRLQRGVDEVRRSGNLRGKPALIVHGRADALVPVNHTSRPYTVLNRLVEGGGSRLSYIEVTNAQHFDGFVGLPMLLPGLDTRFVPLHVYLNRALDTMLEHLRSGAPLPPSQVVRTLPRGGTPGAAPAITAGNVPPIAPVPAAGDAITIDGNLLKVPD